MLVYFPAWKSCVLGNYIFAKIYIYPSMFTEIAMHTTFPVKTLQACTQEQHLALVAVL